jgi:hypothetical protein
MLRSAFATPFFMLTLLVGLLTGPVTSTLAADSSLVYIPVQPCRIFDTRETGGPIAAGTSEDFYVYGDATTMFGQGGNPAGCPAPQGEPIAVHLNITVVPLGDGHIRVYPKGTALPNASTVNYTSGENVANAVTVKTTFDPADLDISVYSSNHAHVLADVQGYFYPQQTGGVDIGTSQTGAVSFSNAVTNITSLTVNAPAAGVVIFTISGSMALRSHVNGNQSAAHCSFSDSDSTISGAPAPAAFIFIPDTIPTFSTTAGWITPFSLSVPVSVSSAGPVTRYFNCVKVTGGGSYDGFVQYIRIYATYSPNEL